MNQLILLVIILVIFVYFGGSMVPSVLKKNKEMLLGVVGGLVLSSFFGMRLEGFDSQDMLNCLAEAQPDPTKPANTGMIMGCLAQYRKTEP